MRTTSSFIVSCAALLVSYIAFPAHADAQWPSLNEPSPVAKVGADDVALLVAVEDYVFLPDVPGASKNIAAWERFLREDVGVSKVLVLKDQQAVREEILDFAERAADAASPEGRLWFVFIGHGAPNVAGDEGMLIGADGQQTASSMMARGLRQSEVLDALHKGKQRDTIAILDACFSGRDASGQSLAKGVQPVLPVKPTVISQPRTVVMSAGASNEVAGQLPGQFPGAERPAFSYLVLGAMRGWADDGDGNVTAQEATEFARAELLGVSGRRQTPQLAGFGALSLSQGATETRPNPSQAGLVQGSDAGVSSTASATDGSTASATPTVTDTDKKPEIRPEDTDGIPDFPLYVKLGEAFGGSGFFASPGFGFSADVGLKINAFTQTSIEWRAALWVNYFTATNAAALGSGDSVNTTDGAVQSVDSGDPVTSVRDRYLFLGVGPGIAWRSESTSADYFDVVPYIDSAFGVAQVIGGRCVRWETDRSSRDAVCAESVDQVDPFVGARIGISYAWVDFAVVSQYVFGNEFITGVTLGFSFDH